MLGPRECFDSVNPERYIEDHISKKRSDRDVVTGTTKVQGTWNSGTAPTSQHGTIRVRAKTTKRSKHRNETTHIVSYRGTRCLQMVR